MSNDMPASSDEQWTRTMELVDEIEAKFAKANGICTVTRCARELHQSEQSPIIDALWAATQLIDEAQAAFEELWQTAIKGRQGVREPVQSNAKTHP